MKKFILLLIALLLLPEINFARPQYSILQSFGAKCQNCHVAPGMGRQRTQMGWMSRQDLSLINPDKIGLGDVFTALNNNNAVWDDKIMFGMDLRYQTARWSTTEPKSVEYPDPFDENETITIDYNDPYATERDYMLMLFTPYLTFQPASWITVEGMYNLAYEIENKKRYTGQEAYSASIILKPLESGPSLRFGMIEPVVGTDWDDHTVMTRMMVTKTTPVPTIPADYAEWGAQLDYQAIDWLGVSVGLYNSENLHEMSGGAVPKDRLSTRLNLTFYPPEVIEGITSFMGGTWFMNGALNSDDGIYYGNDFYQVNNLFLHFGKPGKWAFMSEWIQTKSSYFRETSNFSFEFNYIFYEPLITYARVELGNTEQNTFITEEFMANRYILGAKVNLLPYIALMPEWRLYDRDHVDGIASQFACQLHIFY
jgi:hypothetical protein